MNTCPCCSETLLRHARHNGVYWFCPHCWQEMPDPSLSNRKSCRSLSSLSESSLSEFPELVGVLAVR